MKTFSVAAVAAAVASAANLRNEGPVAHQGDAAQQQEGMVLHNESGAEITVHYEFTFEDDMLVAGREDGQPRSSVRR